MAPKFNETPGQRTITMENRFPNDTKIKKNITEANRVGSIALPTGDLRRFDRISNKSINNKSINNKSINNKSINKSRPRVVQELCSNCLELHTLFFLIKVLHGRS